MRNRIIYILKHNTFLQKAYIIVMSFVFRVISAFVKTDENLVIFVSFMGKGFNDSPKVLYDYIKSHPKYSKYKCVWAFEKPDDYPEIESVKIDTPSYFLTAFRAKYWITNTNIERGLSFKKSNQVYLNTWHGIALKFIGNDCPGRKDYNFDTVDYLVVSGTHDENVFKTAFNAKESSYLRCGMPRNEELWLANEERKLEYRNKLKIPTDKKVILYAPTWRDSNDGGTTYSIKPPIDFKKWEKELGDKYIVLFRAHHLTNKILGVEYNDFVRNVSEYPFVNDLMIAADILITDYSAISFDFSILCRPILCYAYDYDNYLVERGTYFDIDEKYPNKSCRSEDVLFHRIKTIEYQAECLKTKRFRDEFIQYGLESTDICIKMMFGD